MSVCTVTMTSACRVPQTAVQRAAGAWSLWPGRSSSAWRPTGASVHRRPGKAQEDGDGPRRAGRPRRGPRRALAWPRAASPAPAGLVALTAAPEDVGWRRRKARGCRRPRRARQAGASPGSATAALALASTRCLLGCRLVGGWFFVPGCRRNQQQPSTRAPREGGHRGAEVTGTG